MKLLLDENLSRRLVPALQACFPGTSQVVLLGLERATDAELCRFAASHWFVICSKDDDFHRLVTARGYQPKLAHLALGNASNDRILAAPTGVADGASIAVVVRDIRPHGVLATRKRQDRKCRNRVSTCLTHEMDRTADAPILLYISTC